MEIRGEFRGEIYFSGARERDIKVRQGTEKMVSHFWTVAVQLRLPRCSQKRVYLTYKRISRISCRRCHLVCLDVSFCNPALRGETGKRYLVFRSQTTADVPQRCCSVFSFLSSCCLRTPRSNRRMPEKDHTRPAFLRTARNKNGENVILRIPAVFLYENNNTRVIRSFEWFEYVTASISPLLSLPDEIDALWTLRFLDQRLSCCTFVGERVFSHTIRF